MTVYGYARVSTHTQKTDGQVAKLKAAGISPKRIYCDTVSGTKASRPEWDKLMAVLDEGDELVFTEISRIGRSLVNLIDVVTELGERKVGVRSLNQGIFDTTTPTGFLVFGILALLSEWERKMTVERTLAGLEEARAKRGGVLPGRKPSFTPDQCEHALMLADKHPDWSAARIAEAVGTSRATLYRNCPELAGRRAAAKG